RHAVAGYHQLAERCAFGDRSLYRRVVGDLDRGVVSPIARHGHHQVTATDKRHVRAGAEPHRHAFDHVAGGEQHDVLEVRERPVHQAFALLGALVHRVHAVQHQDHPAVAAQRAGDHAVATGIGVTGLQSVGGATLHQRITVLLFDIVVLE